jgi:uncharacterized protein YcfL
MTSSKWLHACAAGALVLALATGCSSRSKSPDFARTDPEALVAARQPVNILNADLRNAVAADIADAERLEDGRLRVRLSLRNSTRKPLTVLVRTVFKDESGLSIGDETPWRHVFFAPQQAQTISSESRMPEARIFTVEVRRP